MNPFDYINSINYTKEDLMVDEVSTKAYNAFIINRGLSYFPDTVLFANEMNINNHLQSRMQYDYLLSTVRKNKRWSKWNKKLESEDVNAVREYYQCNYDRALEILSILTKEQIEDIKKSKGGVKK